MESYRDPARDGAAENLYSPDVQMAEHHAAVITAELVKVLVQSGAQFSGPRDSSTSLPADASRIFVAPRARDDSSSDIEALVQSWLNEHRQRIEDALRKTIFAALIAAVSHALRSWLSKLGYSLCSQARANQDMDKWIAERVQSDIERVGTAIRARVQTIVKEAHLEGASREQILRRIRSFLESSREVEDALKGIGSASSYTATNYGAHLVNSIIGTRTKFWLTRHDGRVCPLCAANEAQGALPIDVTFSSGHLIPPGHWICRCVTAYSDLKEDNIDAALNAFSVVCQNGPS